jgi:hypothetical protein
MEAERTGELSMLNRGTVIPVVTRFLVVLKVQGSMPTVKKKHSSCVDQLAQHVNGK